MRLAELDGRKVGIVGFGREGRAALALLLRHFQARCVRVFDEKPVDDLPDGVRSSVGALEAEQLALCDVLIKSPGVSLYRPAIQAALAQGVRVTSGTNLWFAEPRQCQVVAVTGTKGKSTVASLIAHVGQAAGLPVALAGNIGTPLLELWSTRAELVVVELSSYQTADFEGAPDVALLTNLYPEHLDWHGDVDRYYRDKLRLLRSGTGINLVNGGNGTARALTADLHPTLFNDPSGWQVTAEAICLRERVVAGPPGWELRGGHNRINLSGALAAAEALGIPWQPGLDTLNEFRALPHRQQPVAERNGRIYVDDSIATTPFATLAALEAFSDRPVAVIVGGYDRGLDWKPFAEHLADHPIAGVIVRGENRRHVLEAMAQFAPAHPLTRVDTLADAVEAAEAALGAEGGVVLLSPGAPSYGEFRNFEERGRAFAAIARKSG